MPLQRVRQHAKVFASFFKKQRYFWWRLPFYANWCTALTPVEDAMPGGRTIHASAAARDGAGILLLGPPGAGKSDLVLRLIDIGFSLIADDQVLIHGHHASPPPALAGLLEVRGLGIVRLPHVTADLVLAIRLEPGERLPEPARVADLDLPLINLDPAAASAPLRVAMALDCLQGKLPMHAGAFS